LEGTQGAEMGLSRKEAADLAKYIANNPATIGDIVTAWEVTKLKGNML